MDKIPVGDAILRGYGFGLRRALANFGLSWLAAVFYGFTVFYWLQKFADTMLVSPHPGGELNDFALFDLFCLVVATAFGNAIMAVALTREAMEPKKEIVAASFVFARREWNLFLNLLFLYTALIAVLSAILFAGKVAIAVSLPLVGPDAQWQGISALLAMKSAVVALCFIACVVLIVRFGFFLAPVAADEGAAWPTRSWALSRGNFWRLLVVVSAITLPLTAIWGVVDWALVGQQFSDALAIAFSPRHDSTALYQAINDNADTLALTWTVLVVLLNVLFAGSSAFAYPLVCDSAAVPERSVQPYLEPSFAGSFAAAEPVTAVATRMEPREAAVPESFVAAASPPDESAAPATIPIADAQSEIETPANDMSAMEHDTPVEPAQPIDSIAAMQMPAPAAEAAITPPLSPADATESSPPSAPSEAA